MTQTTIFNYLTQEVVVPVYLLVGSDPYLQENALAAIMQNFDPETIETVRYDLDEVGITTVLDEADTFSFFADQRVVIAEGSDFFTTMRGAALDKAEEGRLLAYLDQPNTASVLIFITEGKLDKRKKLVKQALKQCRLVEVDPLDEGQVARYVVAEIQRLDLEITQEGTDELLRRVDYDLSQAMAELSKLMSYASQGKPITIEVVEQLVPRALATDVFSLTNQLMNREYTLAVQIYRDLILMKHEPIALHALLLSQFRIILQAKFFEGQGYYEQSIASELGVHPYRVKLALQSARSLSIDWLIKFYRELCRLDYEMKQGLMDKETSFYLLLTRLAQEY